MKHKLLTTLSQKTVITITETDNDTFIIQTTHIKDETNNLSIDNQRLILTTESAIELAEALLSMIDNNLHKTTQR